MKRSFISHTSFRNDAVFNIPGLICTNRFKRLVSDKQFWITELIRSCNIPFRYPGNTHFLDQTKIHNDIYLQCQVKRLKTRFKRFMRVSYTDQNGPAKQKNVNILHIL